MPGALGPYAERVGNKPYIECIIDRRAVARYGVNLGDVQDIIMTAIGGMNLTTTVEGRERYPVRVRYKRELRDNIEALRRVLVATPRGTQIPLEQLVHVVKRPGPAKIASEDTKLFVRVFCDVDASQVGLVDFVRSAQQAVRERVAFPPGFFLAWSGQWEAELEARRRLSIVVPVSLALIFLLPYVKFKSWAASVTVSLAMPFALLGGLWLWLQWLLRFKFSTAVWVGYIALFGVAVEDGIVLVDCALGLVRKGLPVDEAVRKAGELRVRPILMTTATTVIALLPIMLMEVSTHTGVEILKPIATPTVGGMLTCTLSDLIVTPVLFSLLYRKPR